MLRKLGWSHLVASILAGAVASAAVADDVFVEQGVVVKPLSKRKQRRLEKKMLRRPGSEVVVEGTPAVTPSTDALAGMKARRALRPLFPDRFGRRNDVVVGSTIVAAPVAGSTVVATPGTVVAGSRTVLAPGDPLVIPGSATVMPSARAARPPIVSTPRGTTPPLEPDDEPELGPDRPATARILPPPADEIPPPVVSIPRRPATPAPAPAPLPTPAPAPAPSVDPGPAPVTPPPAPEPDPAPAPEPSLDKPLEAKPA